MRADYFLSLFVEEFLSGLHIGISRLRLQYADYEASTPLILSAKVPYVIQNIFS